MTPSILHITQIFLANHHNIACGQMDLGITMQVQALAGTVLANAVLTGKHGRGTQKAQTMLMRPGNITKAVANISILLSAETVRFCATIGSDNAEWIWVFLLCWIYCSCIGNRIGFPNQSDIISYSVSTNNYSVKQNYEVDCR